MPLIQFALVEREKSRFMCGALVVRNEKERQVPGGMPKCPFKLNPVLRHAVSSRHYLVDGFSLRLAFFA
jgi:hypothetical protein